jgi:hypothetical protein
MGEKKEKKAFKDTVFGKILGKAGDVIPDVAGAVLKATVGGNPMGAVQDVIGSLTKSKDPKAKSIVTELQLKMAEIELEFSKVELEETKAYLGDVQNARAREVEFVKLGKRDWMQTMVATIGLVMLGFVLYVLVYRHIPDDNKTLFIHFIGIIEGVALSIFGYYFGTSKGSTDKNKLLNK